MVVYFSYMKMGRLELALRVCHCLWLISIAVKSDPFAKTNISPSEGDLILSLYRDVAVPLWLFYM